MKQRSMSRGQRPVGQCRHWVGGKEGLQPAGESGTEERKVGHGGKGSGTAGN